MNREKLDRAHDFVFVREFGKIVGFFCIGFDDPSYLSFVMVDSRGILRSLKLFKIEKGELRNASRLVQN